MGRMRGRTMKLAQGEVITIRCEDDRSCFAANTHRIVVMEDRPDAIVGWPDPLDARCSNNWRPGVDKPLTYPKFAWRTV